MTVRRRGIVLGLAVAAGLALLLLAWAWLGSGDRAVATPPVDEADLRARLAVSVAVAGRTMAAAGAITDSLEEGVRRVVVRIVDDLDVAIRLESRDPLRLPGPPRLCLVGPYSAPDDAGLSDRCWGEPDLSDVARHSLPLDEAGGLEIHPGKPATIPGTLVRGDERCDYPPGTWRLEVAFSPPGTPPGADRLTLADVAFEVSPESSEPLPLLPPGESRYCGLATVVVRDQGEPAVIPASPTP